MPVHKQQHLSEEKKGSQINQIRRKKIGRPWAQQLQGLPGQLSMQQMQNNKKDTNRDNDNNIKKANKTNSKTIKKREI